MLTTLDDARPAAAAAVPMMELNETVDSVLIIATYTIAARLLAAANANATPTVTAAAFAHGLVANLTHSNWSTLTASEWKTLQPVASATTIANYTPTNIRSSGGDDNNTNTTTTNTSANSIAAAAAVNDDVRWPIDSSSVGSVDRTTAAAAASAADATASLVAEWFGKLLQPAVMNSFNVTLEYIETTGRPDADDLDDAGDGGRLLLASAALAGVGRHNATTADGAADGLWLDRDADGLAAVRIGAMAALLAKWVVMSFIILAAIFGNMLVIVSVMQHRRLR